MNPSRHGAELKTYVFTVIGTLLGLLAWLVVTVIAYAGLGVLDYLRGASEFWLQVIFRELFTPGVGGYFAVFAISKYIRNANLKWATIGFCTMLLVFYIGLSIWVISVLRSAPDFSWGEQVLSWLVPVASCFGARLGLSKYGQFETHNKRLQSDAQART